MLPTVLPIPGKKIAYNACCVQTPCTTTASPSLLILLIVDGPPKIIDAMVVAGYHGCGCSMSHGCSYKVRFCGEILPHVTHSTATDSCFHPPLTYSVYAVARREFIFRKKRPLSRWVFVRVVARSGSSHTCTADRPLISSKHRIDHRDPNFMIEVFFQG